MQISLRPPLCPEYVEYKNTPRESLNTVRNCLRNTLKQYPKLTSLKSPTHPHPYPQTNFIPSLTSLNRWEVRFGKWHEKCLKNTIIEDMPESDISDDSKCIVHTELIQSMHRAYRHSWEFPWNNQYLLEKDFVS